MQRLEGTVIDRYRIRERIAKGGMAEIYLAQDLHSEALVALKLVPNSNTEYCLRFQQEVQAIAALHHPHILPALACGAYQSWCYLVTPYIAQGTLDAYLSRHALTVQEAGELLAQLGGALQFAHEHGIIHRDIKPSNVLMLRDDYAYLADFGLARKLNDEPGITASDYLIGTPEYMAPELAEERASVSSDIYALGALLYQMLTGRVPFKGQTAIATFMKQMSEPVVSPSSLNPAIPPAIEKVVLRALEKNPAKRFNSVQALLDAYTAALTVADAPMLAPKEEEQEPASTIIRFARPASAEPEQQAQPGAKASRHRLALPLLAATAMLFISLVLGSLFYSPGMGGNASKLARADIVTTTPPITPKMLNMISLKGETRVQHQPTRTPTQLLHPSPSAANDDDRAATVEQDNGNGGNQSSPGHARPEHSQKQKHKHRS